MLLLNKTMGGYSNKLLLNKTMGGYSNMLLLNKTMGGYSNMLLLSLERISSMVERRTTIRPKVGSQGVTKDTYNVEDNEDEGGLGSQPRHNEVKHYKGSG